MKERPILFSTEMVRAILDGRKSQTRRIIKPQPEIIKKVPYYIELEQHWGKLSFTYSDGESRLVNPKYDIGDVLWVRETWSPIEFEDGTHFRYKASFVENNCLNPKWRPSIFMPKEASRIKLKVTNIRVERLQDITEEDAVAEGIEPLSEYDPKKYGWRFKDYLHNSSCLPKASYQTLWESINGKGSWEVNPWVWVIEFEKL